MNEKDDTQSSTQQRRSRKTNTANQQNGTQARAAQRPTNDDAEAWKGYWKAQGQSWRTEPEIDAARQQYLADRRNIDPDIEKSIYPFKDIKLSRADVEWLLATHEDGCGPVDWNDERQRKREGLDLRGANLIGVDLNGLPLARVRGALIANERSGTSSEQRSKAVVHLEGADLHDAHLEGADLRGAHLERANLKRAHLEGAYLKFGHLEGGNLEGARLEGTYLAWAYLNGKDMQDEDLMRVQQYMTDFPKTLSPANLRYVFLDRSTNLDSITVGDNEHGYVTVVDVRWGDVNLAMVNWSPVVMLGEEYNLHQQKIPAKKALSEKKLERLAQLRGYRRAIRANRQLATALRGQGLNEVADRFAYAAQVLQRKYLWRQTLWGLAGLRTVEAEYIGWKERIHKFWLRTKRFASFCLSLFLDLLAGYGYRPARTLFWYLVVIFGFASVYFTFGHLPLFPDAFVFSLTSFHGRGFFPGLASENSLHNPLIVLAAFEAVVGLIIEISFIATFTQRFFGK